MKNIRALLATSAIAILLILGAWRAKAYTLWFTQDLTQSTWSSGWIIVGNLTGGSGNGVQSFYNANNFTECGSAVGTVSNGTPGEISLSVKWDSNLYGSGSIFFNDTIGGYNFGGSNGTQEEIDYMSSPTGAILSVYWNSNNTQTLLGQSSFAPSSVGDTFTLRAGSPGQGIYYDGNLLLSLHNPYSTVNGGYSYGTCSTSSSNPGNYITSVSVGPVGGYPNAISSSQIGVSAFSNAVDLQWPAATESDPQVPIYEYQIYRNGTLIGSTSSLTYSDTTVTPYTSYTYTLAAVDEFFNSASTNFNVNVPPVGPPQSPTNPPYPSTTPDGRRVGVRPTGAYWGASGENIDVLSGNLSFAQPLLNAQARGGWSVNFNLIYNSQNWRKDSGGTWEFNADVGYGFGWRLMPGAIEPVYNGANISYFIFIDGSGAEYTLNQNAGGGSTIWSSQQSGYVWWDSYGLILHFRDGSFWTFDCVSASNQPDAGFMYPTQMEDTNGNVVKINYMTAPGSSWANSTARITTIEDVRAQYESGGNYYTYQFNYNSNTPPHLTSITNTIGTGENYSFTYSSLSHLKEPFTSTNYAGSTTVLAGVTITNIGTSYQFTTDGSGELTQIQLPYKGTLGYSYATIAYGDGRSFRQVSQRTLSTCNAAGQGCESGSGQYNFSHESSVGYDVHQFTLIEDPSGAGEKYWAFNASGTYEGLTSTYQGRDRNAGGPGNCLSGSGNGLGQCKIENDYAWTQDSTGNSYINQVTNTLDPGQSYAAQNTTAQALDIYGNVTGVSVNNYSSAGGGFHYTGYSYLNSANYTSRYIYNRLSSSYIQDANNNVVGLATITYDCNSGNAPSCFGSGYPTPREWDTNYANIGYRGMATQTTTLSGTSTASYDLFANARSGTSASGVSSSVTTSTSTNYAAPSAITVGSSLTTNLSYSDDFLGLTSASGPSGTSVSLGYDANARPTSTTSPFGGVTTTAYNDTATTPNTCTMVDGRWTQTNLDGLGRPILVITGYGSSCGQGTNVSQTESTYGPCGCTPIGKLMSTAMPHTYGSSPSASTAYTYDGIGRTLSKAVVGSETQGTTSYSYAGNTVTVTDPASTLSKPIWKIFTTDAFGNLIQVTEPNPTNLPSETPNYVTSYTYDLLHHLIRVSMPRSTGTQTRSWSYSGNFLMSATNPENGTVGYTYGANNLLASRTDAKGQQTVYSYDSLARLTQTQHYVNGGGPPTTILVTAYAPSLPAGVGLLVYVYAGASPGSQGTYVTAIPITSISQTYTVPNYLGALGNVSVSVASNPGYSVVIPSITVNGNTLSSNASSVYDTCTNTYAQTTTLSCSTGGFIYQTSSYQTNPPSLQIDNCQTVNYYYDGTTPTSQQTVPNMMGDLSAIQYTGGYNPNASPACDTAFTETYAYGTQNAPSPAATGKTLSVSRGSWSFNLAAGYTYDTEGRTTNETYPADHSGSTANLSYAFDNMGRLNTMTDNVAGQTLVSGVTYGPANEITQISGGSYYGAYAGETRTYNSLKQLTAISTYGINSVSYAYPATGNNGKISSQSDGISGETVTYTYDALNRLATATNSGASPSWGQGFSYDGFGNVTNTSVIQGSAPTMTASYDVDNHAGGEDANGNPGMVPVPVSGTSASGTYDVENRLVMIGYPLNPAMFYSYDPMNDRVWRGESGGTPDEITFWSINGQKLATYQITESGSSLYCTQTGINYYFGGKLIEANNAARSGWVYSDRLDSIGRFYPYGIERPTATGNGTEKFTAYFRDSETGNDYAINRYESPGTGRFLTPDPSMDGVDVSDPGSWNAYAYTNGDPINSTDANGLSPTFSGNADCGDMQISGGVFDGQSVRSVMTGTSGNDLLAQIIWHEGGGIYGSDVATPAGVAAFRQDLAAIGSAVLNVLAVYNGTLRVYNPNGTIASCLLGCNSNATLQWVIIQMATEKVNGVIQNVFNSSGNMIDGAVLKLTNELNTSVLQGPFVTDQNLGNINSACEGILASIATASDLLDGSLAKVSGPNGLVLLAWNQAPANSTTTYPGSIGWTGWRDNRQNGGETFWGLYGGRPPLPPVRKPPPEPAPVTKPR